VTRVPLRRRSLVMTSRFWNGKPKFVPSLFHRARGWCGLRRRLRKAISYCSRNHFAWPSKSRR